MEIKFYDDPVESPKSRDDVRIKQLGLFMYPDGRRVAVGFDITPFLERPSIEVNVVNENGIRAGWMTIVDTMESNFTLTMHLRDKEPTQMYEVTAVLYYATPKTERVDIQTIKRKIDATKPGEQ